MSRRNTHAGYSVSSNGQVFGVCVKTTTTDEHDQQRSDEASTCHDFTAVSLYTHMHIVLTIYVTIRERLIVTVSKYPVRLSAVMYVLTATKTHADATVGNRCLHQSPCVQMYTNLQAYRIPLSDNNFMNQYYACVWFLAHVKYAYRSHRVAYRTTCTVMTSGAAASHY